MSDLPLLDIIEASEELEARERAEMGMAYAAEYAAKLDAGWHAQALDAVRVYARTHAQFLAEDIPLWFPKGADTRASGAIMREARRQGWITPDGYAPANTSNRSPKVRWRSLILEVRP